MELERDDLLGPKELDVSRSEPLRQLEQLTGLKAVKDSVRCGKHGRLSHSITR